MSFTRMSARCARSAAMQCPSPGLILARPSFAIASLVSFSTSAIKFNDARDAAVKLDLIATPLSIITMNTPPIFTNKRDEKGHDVKLSVCGATLQSICVVSASNPQILSFSMRAHDNSFVDGINLQRQYRVKGEPRPHPQCVINVLDAAQAEFAQTFARHAAEPLVVLDTAQGDKANKATAGHPFDSFDLSTVSGPHWRIAWREARPPVLRECHVAYRCTVLLIQNINRVLNKAFEARKAAHDGDEHVQFLVRVDGVEETKAMSGVPLVLHQDVPLISKAVK